MIQIRIILITGLCLTFIQCKHKKDPNKTYFDKPSEYNDYIVNEQMQVMALFDDYAKSINSGKPDSMSFFLDSLSKRTELAQTSIYKLADYKGDTLFRYAALELFRYINYACNHELKQIVEIVANDSAMTDAAADSIHSLSDIYTIKEKEKNDALIIEQNKFAKKFNVIIK